MATLSDAQRAFIDDNPYVAVATTLRADGSPHSTVVWIDATADGVRFNTPRGSAKERHLLADPRVSLVVVDPEDMFRWVSVTGTAAVTDEGADAHIDALAKKYLGVDSYPFRRPDQQRASVVVTIDRVDSTGFSDD